MRCNVAKLYTDEEPDKIHSDWGPTWRPIAYATYGIFEADIPEMNGNVQEVLKYMSNIAHINVKKYAGGSKANGK